MTVGERIKYIRKQRGISQSQLSQASGVPLVSIKRYETDKVHPRPAKLERLAEALGVGVFSLSDVRMDLLGVKDEEGLLRLVITLCEAGILQVAGERDSENKIIPETAELRCCLDASCLFEKLVIWEKVKYLQQQTVAASGTLPEMAKEFLNKSFEETLLTTELELLKK